MWRKIIYVFPFLVLSIAIFLHQKKANQLDDLNIIFQKEIHINAASMMEVLEALNNGDTELAKGATEIFLASFKEKILMLSEAGVIEKKHYQNLMNNIDALLSKTKSSQIGEAEDEPTRSRTLIVQ
jgi:hypothetical protein